MGSENIRVFPRRNLPDSAENWGRVIETRISELAKDNDKLRSALANLSRTVNGAGAALSGARAQNRVVMASVQEALRVANQAQTEAVRAQETAQTGVPDDSLTGWRVFLADGTTVDAAMNDGVLSVTADAVQDLYVLAPPLRVTNGYWRVSAQARALLDSTSGSVELGVFPVVEGGEFFPLTAHEFVPYIHPDPEDEEHLHPDEPVEDANPVNWVGLAATHVVGAPHLLSVAVRVPASLTAETTVETPGSEEGGEPTVTPATISAPVEFRMFGMREVTALENARNEIAADMAELDQALTANEQKIADAETVLDGVAAEVDELLTETIPGLNATLGTVAGEAADAAAAAARAITGSRVEYAQGVSNSEAPATGWSEFAPTHVAGQYLWMRTVVVYGDDSTATSDAVLVTGNPGEPGAPGEQGEQGEQGEPGAPPPVVTLTATSQALVSPAEGGVTTPATATITGAALNTTISLWHYSVNGGEFTTTAPAGVSRSGNTVTVTGATMAAQTVTVRAADAAGVADTITVAKVVNGDTATTLVLSNESHTFPGSTTAALAGSTVTAFTAYRGSTQVAATVGTITGAPNGMSTSIQNNGTTTAQVTVTVTPSLTAQSGVLTIPVTVAGVAYSKAFSWSVARQGAEGDKGDTGSQGISVTSITPFFRLVLTGSDAPSQPSGTGNPSGWTTTEPAYVAQRELYRTERILYSNDTAAWTPVTKVSAYTAAVSLKTEIDANKVVVDNLKDVTLPALETSLGQEIDAVNDLAQLSDKRLTVSSDAPSDTTGYPVGAYWIRVDASNREIGYWRLTAVGWATTSLDPVVIPVLDAGKITSGVIDTARLNAQEIAAAVATVITLNADRITSGTINTARLNAEQIAAAVASFLTLNASQITAGTIDTARLNATEIAAAVATIISLDASRITTGTLGADRIAARSITADKLLIGSGDNLQPDPTFLSAEVWPSSYRQGTGGEWGGGSWLIPAGTGQRGNYSSYQIPVIPGESYRLQGYVSTLTAPPVGGLSMYLRLHRADGSVISFIRAANGGTATDQWIDGILTMPDDAAYALLGLFAEASHTGDARFSSVSVTRATNASLIVDGGVQARHILADSAFVAMLNALAIVAGGLDVVDETGLPVVSLKSSGTKRVSVTDASGMIVATISPDGTVSGRVGRFDDIQVYGSSLQAHLNFRHETVARTVATSIAAATSGETRWATISFTAKPGRRYSLRSTPIQSQPTGGTPPAAQRWRGWVRARYTLGGAEPTASSTLISTWTINGQGPWRSTALSIMKYMDLSVSVPTVCRVVVTVTPEEWAQMGTGPIELSVVDEGPLRAIGNGNIPGGTPSGGGGATGAVRQPDIDLGGSAAWWGTYSNGAPVTWSPYTSTAGQGPWGGRTYHTAFGWGPTIADTIPDTGAQITAMRIQVKCVQSATGTVKARLGFIAANSKPGSFSGVNPAVTVDIRTGEAVWIDVPSAYWAGWINGSLRAAALSTGSNSTTSADYGRFDPAWFAVHVEWQRN